MILTSRSCVLYTKAATDLARSLQDETCFGVVEQARELGGDRIAIIRCNSLTHLQETEADIRTRNASQLNPTVRFSEFTAVVARLRSRAILEAPLFTTAANDKT